MGSRWILRFRTPAMVRLAFLASPMMFPLCQGCLSRSGGSAPESVPVALAQDPQSPSPGVGISLTVETTGPAFPWALRVILEGEGGGERSLVFRLQESPGARGEPAHEGGIAKGPTATGSTAEGGIVRHLAVPFRVPPGRWRIKETLLLVEEHGTDGGKRFPERTVPFTLVDGMPPLELGPRTFLHLGELKVHARAADKDPGPRDISFKTTYFPLSPPSVELWRPHAVFLAPLAMENIGVADGGSWTQTPVLFPLAASSDVAGASSASSTSGPTKVTQSAGTPTAPHGNRERTYAWVSLLADTPGMAIFADEAGKVFRIPSEPLSGTPYHLFNLRLEPGEASTLSHEGNVGSEGFAGSKVNREPFQPGTVRYVGFLRSQGGGSAPSLDSSLPAEAREAFYGRFAGAEPRTFILGEAIRTRPPGTWEYLDGAGKAVPGFPEPEGDFIRRLHSPIAQCARALWDEDPLSPTEFSLWIANGANGTLEVVGPRSQGFVGPGLVFLKGCLDAALQDNPEAAGSGLGRGFGVRFK